MPAEPPRYGDRVRVRCGATGRYVGWGLALVVSAQDNDLLLDRVNPDGDPPSTNLPVPDNGELDGARVALRWREREVPDAERAEVTP